MHSSLEAVDWAVLKVSDRLALKCHLPQGLGKKIHTKAMAVLIDRYDLSYFVDV